MSDSQRFFRPLFLDDEHLDRERGPMIDRNRNLLIALNADPFLTRAVICRLADRLESWLDTPTPRAITAAALGIPLDQLEAAAAVARNPLPLADREHALAQRHGARILTRLDDDYPSKLFDLSLPPPVVYCAGEVPAGPALAMVGSRKADEYGREVATTLARELASAGVTVVSGFALGVDAAAHQGALEVPGGKTLAVLGCGLDVHYPRHHRSLGRAIREHGALLTELPFGTPPRPYQFPVRNRLIAVLSAATVVVQAAARSGSLITARYALELGRDVLAVPGPIFNELSLGANGLIRHGAAPALHPRDLLDLLGLPEEESVASDPELAPPVGEAAARIFAKLPRRGRVAAEDLSVELDWAVDRVLTVLLELELGGWAIRHPGPSYSRCGARS